MMLTDKDTNTASDIVRDNTHRGHRSPTSIHIANCTPVGRSYTAVYIRCYTGLQVDRYGVQVSAYSDQPYEMNLYIEESGVT